MRKTVIIHTAVAFTALVGLSACGAYSGVGYDDGIYGDEAPRPVYQREEPRYERNYEQSGSYREHLNQKIAGYKDFEQQVQRPAPSYTPMTNVEGYRTDTQQQSAPYNTYGSWGDNARPSSVNIYNNYVDSPYYWGSGAWGGYYSSSYYYPRSRWSIGFSVGTYDPYWSWRYYDSYYYPYYGYYYDYRPRDYYYEPSRSYGHGGSYSGRGRAIIRDDNYRSNANRYEDGRGSYSRSQSQGYYNNNGNYSGRPSYQNQQYNNNPPTGYETRRAYESNSNYSGRSSNYSNSSSSGGNYSSGSSNSSSSSSGGYRSSNRD